MVAEHVGEQPAVAGGGYAVHGIERCHHRACSGIDGGFVGAHIFVEGVEIVGIDIVVLSSGFHQPIECKVLDARHHRCGVCQRCALVAVHHGFGYAATEIGVFSAALADTSPSAVMADVHHRRERPAYTVGRSLAGSDTCRLLDGVHIP